MCDVCLNRTFGEVGGKVGERVVLRDDLGERTKGESSRVVENSCSE